ncbi:hypothetical protein N7478_007357 [Penicillium angulare]|uniref:uncharacterized protein n=1 Tax=Penicillium angulare TaxID=116970 RepID=UPI0025409E7C|nr:uncharacterized protein N7478_007357 [Penicillium angulare]KAJ5281985.1 hypothetical protein N7478_007357 [Penicillium angulare]
MGPRPQDVISHISKRALVSYIIDWVFIIGVALIGYAFYKQTPNQHPFSLSDPTISYPYTKDETVTDTTLVLVTLLAPAAIVVLGAILFVPGTAAPAGVKPSIAQVLRRKFWEWNVGWMGLGVAYAGAFMATQGLKVVIGRPRPDLLARCDPDIDNISAYAVGGLGQSLPGATTMVWYKICRKQDSNLRIDGFSSFPSGHSSSSFAGLGYLTLWLAAKTSVGFPYLPSYPIEGDNHHDDEISIRKRGAAPPVMLMVLAFVPTCTAFFIAASRWFNYRHHAFDIIFGSLMGAFFAWVGFNMYQLPIRRGAGWAWGPRTGRRAFIRGFGFPSSLGIDNWTYRNTSRDELDGSTAHTQDVRNRQHEQNNTWPQITVDNGYENDSHNMQEIYQMRQRPPPSPVSPLSDGPAMV